MLNNINRFKFLLGMGLLCRSYRGQVAGFASCI